MNNKIQKLSELEAMLVKEGEDGPTLCCSRHEVVLAQENSRRSLMELPLLTSKTDRHILEACKNNSKKNRMCAHNDMNFNAGVYRKEIDELWNEKILDVDSYQNLSHLNADAAWAIYDYDKFASDLAAKKEFHKNKNVLEQRQWEVWENFVNPLRKSILELVQKEKAKLNLK